MDKIEIHIVLTKEKYTEIKDELSKLLGNDNIIIAQRISWDALKIDFESEYATMPPGKIEILKPRLLLKETAMQTDASLKTDIQKVIDKLNTLISLAAYKGLTIKYNVWNDDQIGVPNFPIISVKLQRIQ